MKKLASISACILALSIASFAQTDPDPNCPTISVDGPAGVVSPGDIARYTVNVDDKGRKQNLEYLWSVSAGEIISGQGTPGIEVRQPENARLTVTVKVNGVPEGCPNISSETSSGCDGLPISVKLAQFDGATFIGNKLDLDKIVREMDDSPNDQLYIYFAYKNEPAGKTEQNRERRAVDYLADAIGGRERITIVRLFDGVDLAQFWRVPPGASNPLCDGCDGSACPKISVIAPAGITEPGELFSFSAKIDGEVPKNVSYRWSVSKGEIIEGQGSLGIKVKAEWKTEINLIATIEVIGSPEGCPNAASEISSAACNCTPILFDEFTSLASRIDKVRFDVWVEELRKRENATGYIIEYFLRKTAKKVVDKKIVLITSYLTKTKGLDAKSFKVVVVIDDQNRTKLYIVPPDAEFPAP